jgi:uncharacterized membrane protein
MSWSRRFRRRERIRGSMWIVPLLGALLGAVAGLSVAELDRRVNLPNYFQYSSSTASTFLTAIVGATAALTGFVVTVTTLMVQMVTGMFSPRYMRLWYRDPMLKATLGFLAGTLTFSFSLLRRIEPDFVPNAGVSVSGVLMVASLILFLFFFGRCMSRLRPVAVASLVADAGIAAFEKTRKTLERSDVGIEPRASAAEPSRVVRAADAGAIQAIHVDGLVRWARKHDAQLVLTCAVGDFVRTGEKLVSVYGGNGDLAGTERELNGMIALGDERTIEQDPAFAIRIMVDIALMALSPAVNAPTTATQVLGHLGETLRVIGETAPGLAADGSQRDERPAVVMCIQGWEDYLTLGVTEIREYGLSGIQVMRALRATLEELREDVSPKNRAAVEEELARLEASVAAHWGGKVDFDRATVADAQGIGGPGLALEGGQSSEGSPGAMPSPLVDGRGE